MGKKFFGVGSPTPSTSEEKARDACPECGGEEFRFPVEGNYRMKKCLNCGWKTRQRIEPGVDYEVEYTEPQEYRVRTVPKYRPVKPIDLYKIAYRQFDSGVFVRRKHEED